MMWVDDTQVGGTLTKIGNSVQYSSVSISGLNVQLKYDALSSSPTLRSYLTMANPTNHDITVSFDYGNNFGSGDDTQVAGTSDGDDIFTEADNWIVTDDSSTDGNSLDPANLSVFYGPESTLGAPDLVSQTVWECNGKGIEGVRVHYDRVTIPAQSTRALIFFQEIHGTSSDALSAAANRGYVSQPLCRCSDIFSGLPLGEEINQVLNWAIVGCAGEIDTDNDGLLDCLDNCPNDANLDQADTDRDGVGDACDICPNYFDNGIDGDGACWVICPSVSNADQADGDGDGVGDACAPDIVAEMTGPLDIVDLQAASFVIAEDCDIEDVDVTMSIDHTWVANLIMTLTSPNGTTAVLVDRKGSFQYLVATSPITFDDDSSITFDDVDDDPIPAGSFRSVSPGLTALNGESSQGIWTLDISDTCQSCDDGVLRWARLEIRCLNQPPAALCKDASFSAGPGCVASVTVADVNDGSSDPEDSLLTGASLSISSSGPFGPGETIVELTATDSQGVTGTCSSTVTVQDTTAPIIVCSEVAPIKVGETFHAVSSSTDNCDSSLTTTNECDDYTVVGNEFNFTTAGVFTCTATVTDDAGNKAICPFMLPVYDPSAGFVTGGGQIDSLAGALNLNPSLSGRAAFGFSSKYEGKGAKIPTGDTSFVFKAGGLIFASTEYEWLVVTGSNHAKFKGEGIIDGEEGAYKFQVWAGDGGKTSDDTFRIKIWEEASSSEIVVYDNGADQPIARGQIKVHAPKEKVRALRGP